MTCTVVVLLERIPHFDVVYYNYSKNAQTLCSISCIQLSSCTVFVENGYSYMAIWLAYSYITIITR